MPKRKLPKTVIVRAYNPNIRTGGKEIEVPRTKLYQKLIELWDKGYSTCFFIKIGELWYRVDYKALKKMYMADVADCLTNTMVEVYLTAPEFERNVVNWTCPRPGKKSYYGKAIFNTKLRDKKDIILFKKMKVDITTYDEIETKTKICYYKMESRVILPLTRISFKMQLKKEFDRFTSEKWSERDKFEAKCLMEPSRVLGSKSLVIDELINYSLPIISNILDTYMDKIDEMQEEIEEKKKKYNINSLKVGEFAWYKELAARMEDVLKRDYDNIKINVYRYYCYIFDEEINNIEVIYNNPPYELTLTLP